MTRLVAPSMKDGSCCWLWKEAALESAPLRHVSVGATYRSKGLASKSGGPHPGPEATRTKSLRARP